jgi:hypothetical protein
MAVQTALGLALNVARGGEVLDQSFICEGGSVSGVDDMAQTFTVGRLGTLSGVEVELFGEAAVVLDVRRTTSAGYPSLEGVPGGTLGSVLLTPPNTRFEFVRADFQPFGISVEPGEVLVLVLHGAGNHSWRLSTGAEATYAGGEAFIRMDGEWRRFPDLFPSLGPGDLHFQTFVIPEPSLGALLAAGVVSFLVSRRPLLRAS